MKTISAVSRVSILLIVLFLLASCATWKPNVTAGYESTSEILVSIRSTAKAMCTNETLSKEDCAKFGDLYNKLRLVYITAGDSLVVAMNAETAAQKNASLADYQKAMTDIGMLLPELIRLADTLGIKI